MSDCLPIVVIGQNYCTSLGIIKALGEAGYCVEVGKRIIGTPRFYTPEIKSKYVVKAIYLQTGPDDEMIKSIIDNFAPPCERKILIPADDYCVALVDRHFDELTQFFILPNVRQEQGALSPLMNKWRQNELAKKSRINVANSVIIKVSPGDVFAIPEKIPYPCLTKPIESVGSPKSFIRKCENKEELIAHISKIAQTQECTILVEQFIEIEKEYTIPGVAIGGIVIIPAAIEKLRTGDGQHKGVTISGIVKNSDILEDVVGKLRTFVREMGFQGIFDIELLQSDGNFYFNEINLRNGAAGYSLTKSGINLPAIYANYLVKFKIPQLSQKLVAGRTFVNEKAALDNYLEGYSSFGMLLQTVCKADMRFMLCLSDIKSCMRFCLLLVGLIVKKILK